MTTKAKTSPENDFDWGAADGSNQEYTDIYPRIQWQHGHLQMQKLGGVVFTGGLFIPKDQYPNFNSPDWNEDSFMSSKNEEITGFSTARGYLAVIRTKTWWSENEEGKKSSQTHFLCCVKGIDGLFSLQVGGVSKGMPMNQAFNDHRKQIVALVNRSKPENANSFEPFAMWFVVEPGPHDKQVSAKNASASSEVTRPRLYLPDTLDLDYCRSLWVGSENYKTFIQLYKETAAWQTQFPKSQIVDDANGDAPAFTGVDPTDAMTKEQADNIVALLEVKNIGVDELNEICMTVTDGACNNYQLLKKHEASAVYESLKAY